MRFSVKMSENRLVPCFDYKIINILIIESNFSYEQKYLLDFIRDIIKKEDIKKIYETPQIALKLEDDKNNFKIWDLMNELYGYNKEFDTISINKYCLIKLLEVWLKEEKLYNKNPKEYKKLIEENWWAIEREVELEDEVESWVKVFEG